MSCVSTLLPLDSGNSFPLIIIGLSPTANEKRAASHKRLCASQCSHQFERSSTTPHQQDEHSIIDESSDRAHHPREDEGRRGLFHLGQGEEEPLRQPEGAGNNTALPQKEGSETRAETNGPPSPPPRPRQHYTAYSSTDGSGIRYPSSQIPGGVGRRPGEVPQAFARGNCQRRGWRVFGGVVGTLFSMLPTKKPAGTRISRIDARLHQRKTFKTAYMVICVCVLLPPFLSSLPLCKN